MLQEPILYNVQHGNPIDIITFEQMLHYISTKQFTLLWNEVVAIPKF